MKTTGIDTVFVYGSLKRGFHNHDLLAQSNFIDAATTNARFDMFSLGFYPAVVVPGRFCIQGEVYQVDAGTLADLDLLEGNKVYYLRHRIAVTTTSGRALRAWMFVLLRRESGMGRIPPLPCGTTKTWPSPKKIHGESANDIHSIGSGKNQPGTPA